MCLIAKDRMKDGEDIDAYKERITKIARKDIIVYKMFENNWKSPFNGFKYKPGFHYYQDDNDLGFDWFDKYDKRISVEAGLHAYTTLKGAHQYIWGKRMVIQVIIPKGAKYVRGTDNEIVSTDLIIPHDAKPIPKSKVKK